MVALPLVSRQPLHLAMTIIRCLPGLPVEVFGICSLLSSVLSAPTLRLETGRLNSLLSWVKSQAIDYALTRACFHAGEIRVLDSSGVIICTIRFEKTDRKLRSFRRIRNVASGNKRMSKERLMPSEREPIRTGLTRNRLRGAIYFWPP